MYICSYSVIYLLGMLHKELLKRCIQENEIANQENHEIISKNHGSRWRELPPDAAQSGDTAAKWAWQIPLLTQEEEGFPDEYPPKQNLGFREGVYTAKCLDVNKC